MFLASLCVLLRGVSWAISVVLGLHAMWLGFKVKPTIAIYAKDKLSLVYIVFSLCCATYVGLLDRLLPDVDVIHLMCLLHWQAVPKPARKPLGTPLL